MNVVINVAASVDFNLPLNEALAINVMGNQLVKIRTASNDGTSQEL